VGQSDQRGKLTGTAIGRNRTLGRCLEQYHPNSDRLTIIKDV
jgi:hypothetical protein